MRFKDKVKADDNRKRAFTYLTQKKGLEPHIAAGILGNFMQEAGQNLNVEAYNPNDLGKPSFGLAQWRGDRMAQLKKIAGKKANTLEGQLDFMMWEFENTEKRAYKKVQEASTSEEAALAFSQYYERPHKNYAHNEKRVKYAKTLFNNFVGEDETYDENYTYAPEEQQTVEPQVAVVQPQQEEPEFNPNNYYSGADYTVPMYNNTQIPYLGEATEQQATQDNTAVAQTPILDAAVSRIEGRKAEMAMLQKMMKANEVQYIDPNAPDDPEPNSYGYPSMEEGGETDPKKKKEVPKEYDFFNDPDNLYTESNKKPVAPRRSITERRGREPLNLAVRETTGVVRRDTTNPLLTPMKENQYDEFTDPKNINVHDLGNETVIVDESGKRDLEEKVKSKSELLNPLGMEKIDPNAYKSPEEVARLQALLMENGYDVGEHGADGKIGSNTMKAINKFNAKLSLTDELSVGEFKTPEQVKELQEFLISKDFDLNPNGKFEDDGVDGKLGEVTQKALLEYNKKVAKDSLPYKGVKDGLGFLGDCAEEQCSEYVQNEIWRNLNPEMSRDEWNSKTGLQGDAWTIGKNIVKAGGRELKVGQGASGDVVTIFTGGRSPYQTRANKEGTGTTHTAVIDQVNADGSFYILHNVHKGSELTGWIGQEYRDLVNPDGRIAKGKHAGFQIKGVYRPSVEGVKGKKNPNLRKDVTLAIDPDKMEQLSSINSILGSAPEKIQTFVKPLNDYKNKEKFAQIFELDEDEYQALAQLTIGVLGQETNFGTNPIAKAKEYGATASKLINIATWGQIDSPVIKKDEVSKGAGRLKYDTNFHADLTEFGINKSNFDDDENASITSLYKLSTDYNKFKKAGYSNKDALYRAAVVYNASLQGTSGGKKREEWAKDYDVDYANKALQFASALGVQGEEKQYKTVIDELLLEDNVHKWNKKAYTGRN